MLFVFLSHFAEVYFKSNGMAQHLSAAYKVSMLASPMFMLISGIMLGYLYATEKDGFPRTKASLMNRGLFVLTLGRLVIMLAHLSFAGGLDQMLRWSYMTDTIGVSILLGPLLIQRVGRLGRMALGATLFVISWIGALTWVPSDPLLDFCKETLFGPAVPYDLRVYADVFPLVPWFSVYLGGSVLGEGIGALRVRGQRARIPVFVLGASVVMWAMFSFLMGVRFLFAGGDGSLQGSWIQLLLAPFVKLPPSPAYVFFYGGVGLLVLYVLFRFEGNAVVAWAMKPVVVLGQTSLFVFIIQYFMYYTVLVELDLGVSALWPVYFLGSVVVICAIAYAWYRAELNQYLRVPYLSFSGRAVSTLRDSRIGM